LHLQFVTLHLKTLSNRIHPLQVATASKGTAQTHDGTREAVARQAEGD